MKKCEECNYELPKHHSMCPNRPENTDVYQYQHSQMDDIVPNEMQELQDEFDNNIDGNINNIEGYLFHEECGDR